VLGPGEEEGYVVLLDEASVYSPAFTCEFKACYLKLGSMNPLTRILLRMPNLRIVMVCLSAELMPLDRARLLRLGI